MPSITCENSLLQGTLFYDQTPLLSYQIHYPQFFCVKEESKPKPINDYYSDKAAALENYCKTVLMDQAIQQYKTSQKQDFPMDPYEVVQKYNITELSDDLLSLYYDQYIYTGGAHGNTVRYSNIWDLTQCSILRLQDFFPGSANFSEDITNAVTEAVNRQMALPKDEQSCLYFNDYQQRIAGKFNKNNSYLVPEGVVVYYQQYDIAPYYCGILQFLIPYTDKCKKE